MMRLLPITVSPSFCVSACGITSPRTSATPGRTPSTRLTARTMVVRLCGKVTSVWITRPRPTTSPTASSARRPMLCRPWPAGTSSSAKPGQLAGQCDRRSSQRYNSAERNAQHRLRTRHRSWSQSTSKLRPRLPLHLRSRGTVTGPGGSNHNSCLDLTAFNLTGQRHIRQCTSRLDLQPRHVQHQRLGVQELPDLGAGVVSDPLRGLQPLQSPQPRRSEQQHAKPFVRIHHSRPNHFG